MPKGRILAVDDQRYFRELIEGLLVEDGFEAQTAASGEEALRILETASFDIVLTDLVMPGMDGGELVRRIKERDPEQDVVVVTGVVDVKTAVEAMKLGATDYLLKPFDRVTLSTFLEGILQRGRLRTEHARLLAENIEYMGERSLFERAMALFGTLALDPLAEQIVEALCVETRAQAGVIWLVDADEPEWLRLVAGRGLVHLAEESEALRVADLPLEIQNGPARVVLQAWGDAQGEQRAPLYLAMRRDAQVTGLVRLSDKLGGEEFDAVDRACAEKLLGYAEGAISNALRFRARERRNLADPATGAYVPEFFDDVLRSEIEKAARFHRTFSVAAIEAANLDGLRARGGEQDVENWLAHTARQLRRLMRATDVLAAHGEHRFLALLAEADSLGAAAFKRRAREALARGPLLRDLDADVRPQLRFGIASYPADGSQAEGLHRALEARLAEEQSHPVAEHELERLSLAEALRRLLDEPDPQAGSTGDCSHLEGLETAEQIVRFAFGELRRRPQERWLLIVAPGELLEDALDDGLDALRGVETAARIAVVAEEAGPPLSDPEVVWVAPGRVPGLPPFLIHYGDGPAYALVCEDKQDGSGLRFAHTSDRLLVEYLAFRLQRELGLPQLTKAAGRSDRAERRKGAATGASDDAEGKS